MQEETATAFEALTAAVARAGSQAAFARICGVSQPGVWKWLQSGKRLPAEYVLVVEAATGVSRHLLRPDIYPRDLPKPAGLISPAAACAPIVGGGRHALPQRKRRRVA